VDGLLWEFAVEILKSMSLIELGVTGAVFVAGVIVLFWLYYRNKP